MKKNIIWILLFLCILVINSCSTDENYYTPVANKGILDLNKWDLHNNIALSGEWEMYWNQLLTPIDFDKNKDLKPNYVTLPSFWNSIEVNSQKLPNEGYATYRLQIVNIEDNKFLAIDIKEILTSYKCYVNGELIAENGKVGKSKSEYEPDFIPLLKPIDVKTDTVEIIFQIANYVHRNSGFFTLPKLGKIETLTQNNYFYLTYDIFLFGAILIMAIYHFGIYFLRRKNISSLYFALFCIFLGLRILTTGQEFIKVIFHNFPWEFGNKIEYSSLFLAPLFIAFFILETYKQDVSKIFVYIISTICILFSLTLFAPFTFYSRLVAPFQITIILGIFYLVFVLFKALIKKRDGALVMIISIFFFFFAIINDILYTNGFLNSIELTPLGLFVLILGQSNTLAIQFNVLFHKNEQLTVELNYNNQNLEKIVEERTIELRQQQVELKERNEELISAEEELRQNNEELQTLNETIDEKEKRLAYLIENQGEGFITVNLEEQIQFANPAANEIYGNIEKTIVGHNVRDFLDNDQFEILEKNSKMRLEGKKSTYVLTINTLDKQKKYVQITGTPDFDSENNLIGTIAVVRDITELKKIESKLKSANLELRKYFVAIDQSPITIVITAPNGNIEYVNPHFIQLTGFSYDEVIGRNPRILKSDKNKPELFADLWRTITKAKVWEGEIKNLKKDGTEFIEKALISPIINDDGVIINYVAIKEDITEKKYTEQLIREKTRQQQIILNNLPAYIYFKDINLRYLLVNESYAQFFKLPSFDIIGKTDRELEVVSNVEIYENHDLEVIRSKKSILNSEIQNYDSEGIKYWTSTSKVPYFDNKGNVQGIIGIVQDITKRKESEQIILEKTRQFENTISNLEDVYFRIDNEGNLLQASHSMCNLLGYETLEEIFEHKIFDKIYNEEKLKPELYEPIKLTGKLINYAIEFKNRLGEVQFGLINANQWFDINNNVGGIEGIIHNISERIKFEKELGQLNRNLINSFEELQKQKETLERAHNRITESINYAQRIQQAIIHSEELIYSILPDSFIFFKPRDIVSGDFYFVDEVSDNIIIMAADCTGHGVPGAFMSILGFNFVQEIIYNIDEKLFIKPSDVLEILRTKIIKALPQSIKDGMDASLVFIDRKTKIMQFAGANNSVYVTLNKLDNLATDNDRIIVLKKKNQIHKNFMIEIKADKQPIGKYVIERPFTTQELQLHENSIIYLFSDGFLSQFGDKNKRKYLAVNFKDFLFSIHNKSLKEQKNILEKEFDIWKGETQQIDDVLVIGVKI